MFRGGTATTALATSAASTVYVIPHKSNTKATTCSGTQCQSTDTVTDLVPPSALSTEVTGRWLTYFGVSYAASGTPAAPATLQQGAGAAVVSALHQVSADEFQVTLTFSWPTNGENYSASWHHCTASMEAQDGAGLPGAGDYGCGGATMPNTDVVYIG